VIQRKLVYSIGHSTRMLEDFMGVLRHYRIQAIVDVRRFPSSKKFPWFCKDSLREALSKHGIEYHWLEALGGFRGAGARCRAGKCLKKGGFQAYKQHMETKEFQRDFAFLKELAMCRIVAVMCAELLYWKCHRMLICEKLALEGFTVMHIFDETRVQPHRLINPAEDSP
jgi:uncharacterized protein (DUF488 family)